MAFKDAAAQTAAANESTIAAEYDPARKESIG
jgi:hypothetical protein